MRRRRPDDTPFEEMPTGMVRRGRGGGTANSRFRPTRYKRSVACVTVWLASTEELQPWRQHSSWTTSGKPSVGPTSDPRRTQMMMSRSSRTTERGADRALASEGTSLVLGGAR